MLSSQDDTTAGGIPQHFVCTHGQAKGFIEKESRFRIATCSCRKTMGGCSRSRMDVCLTFNPEFSTGTDRRDATKEDALALIAEADAKGLIARPFRKPGHPDQLDGICFCCPECCFYFQHQDEICDKGTLRESTDMDACASCGLCVDICHFGARKMVNGTLAIDADKCYGCGLCVDACASGCITMK